MTLLLTRIGQLTLKYPLGIGELNLQYLLVLDSFSIVITTNWDLHH